MRLKACRPATELYSRREPPNSRVTVMRFSLRWLLVAILLIAVCVVALLNANAYWASGARSVLLLLLSLCVVGAVFCKGRLKVFWTGFAIFALFHFAFAGHV